MKMMIMFCCCRCCCCCCCRCSVFVLFTKAFSFYCCHSIERQASLHMFRIVELKIRSLSFFLCLEVSSCSFVCSFVRSYNLYMNFFNVSEIRSFLNSTDEKLLRIVYFWKGNFKRCEPAQFQTNSIVFSCLIDLLNLLKIIELFSSTELPVVYIRSQCEKNRKIFNSTTICD